VKEFAKGVIERAQRDGLVKALDAKVLMELMFGAFIGMMRAHWEGRIELDDSVVRAAEQACWDAVSVHPLTYDRHR
jgi:TetR/AcrR family transcriptional regulator, repressor of fatR-cypB operon